MYIDCLAARPIICFGRKLFAVENETTDVQTSLETFDVFEDSALGKTLFGLVLQELTIKECKSVF